VKNTHLGEFGGKIKILSTTPFVGNMQMSVGKLELPVPHFLNRRRRWEAESLVSPALNF